MRLPIILAVFAASTPAAFAAPAAAPAAAAMSVEARAVADRFFRDPALGETRALLVLVDGRTAYERYAPGFGAGTRLIGWSMTKSVTATLVGQLVGEGRLRLDDPAPVPAWRKPGDPRRAITLRQLLHMSSGLRHLEAGPVPERNDEVRLLFTDGAADAARYATAKPLQYRPGAKWVYSTATSVILADIVQRTLHPGVTDPARRRALFRQALEERLLTPAGMTSMVCETDAAGTMLGGSLCHATARDWARFGQIYLDGGVVNGRRVVPAEWVRFVRTPSPGFGGYGAHWWVNAPLRRGEPDDNLFRRQGPADAFAAVGHLGQYVIVAPSKRAVVVRLGRTWDPDLQPVRTALGRLVNSLPDAPPGRAP